MSKVRSIVCRTIVVVVVVVVEGNAINLARKFPISFVANHYVME